MVTLDELLSTLDAATCTENRNVAMTRSKEGKINQSASDIPKMNPREAIPKQNLYEAIPKTKPS